MRRFPRTFQALDEEGPGVSLVGLVLVTLLLIAWLVWLFAARISVFEVTPVGRLEADRAAYPITSQVDGKVIEVPMTMGRRVEPGDLLVQLDTRELELRRREEEARLASIEHELEAIRPQLELRQQTLEGNRRTTQLALEDARAQLRRAELEADFADEDAKRQDRLYREGQVSQVEAERSESEARRLRESVTSYRLIVERREAEVGNQELSDRTDLAQLRRAVAQLEGEAATAEAAIETIRYEIERHSIRAPQSGEIGDVIDLRVQSVIRAGERLGTILAPGNLRVVAELDATSALGRVALGQEARVRLDGFPWTQYGMMTATVARVASEPRAGRLRVELEVSEHNTSRVPLRHGLTGTVEIEVERISPAGLLLRTLGKALRPAPAPLGAPP